MKFSDLKFSVLKNTFAAEKSLKFCPTLHPQAWNSERGTELEKSVEPFFWY